MKQIINTITAPKPIGIYSQGILINNLLFISGQIGISPVNNKIILNNITKEIEQIMNNIRSILNEASMNLSNIIKTTVYLKNINHISYVNNIYNKYFHKNKYPVREVVEVSNLPNNVNVEISSIAYKK